MTYYGAKNLANSYRTVRKNTIAIAEEIPAEQYSFKAAPDTMSVGEMLAHLAAAYQWHREVHTSHQPSIDFAFFAPIFNHPADFALDRDRVALHVFAAQRGVVQHLLAALRARVEHHALAEDRCHEWVGLGLVEILIRGPEEELVGFGAGEKDDVLAGELEPADVAALVADPLHQPDRVGAEFLEVSVLLGSAGNPRNLLELLARHDSSGYFSCCRSFGELDSGASGWISMFTMNPPRGVSATKAMHRARSEARRK